MKLQSINPATGEEICCHEEMSEQDVDQMINRTHDAFLHWRTTDFTHRAECLKRAAQILRERQDAYARLAVDEMGKPLAQALGEVEKCAWVCEYYADHGESFVRPEMVATDASKSYVAFEPLGIIFAVMPWNFPYWQVFRFLAPALMAGNGGLLKHSENVCGCALAIEEIVRDAGFPEDLFRTLLISRDGAAKVIAHERVMAVTLTGSTAAGKAVASQAGACIKKAVLELGGSDPYLILEDANLEEAAQTCVASRMINGGQSCIAAKRFIVVSSVKERFEKLFVENMRAFKMGDPYAEGVTVGPMARHDLRDGLHKQVDESVKAGATVLLGGAVPDGPGAFYPPTVLTNVKPGMPAYEDELFGPVASIIEANDEADAIRIANDSIYGLGSAVFTGDSARGERIAKEGIQSGACFVNSYVKSDPRMPFGGIKQSGYGRELSSFGMREFVNIKSIYIK